MNITKVTVKKIEGQQVLRGVASVVLDDEIKIRDIKILERESGLSIIITTIFAVCRMEPIISQDLSLQITVAAK